MPPMDRRTHRSKRPGDQVIFGADPLPAIVSLEAAHRKMTTGDVLEMLDERVIHRSAAEGADDWEGLRGDLLRDHQSEACSDLSHEFQEDRRSFLEEAAFSDEAGGFRHRLGEHTSNGEISALRCVGRPGPPAQCEDFDAGEGGLRIGQVLALAACNVRDRLVETGSSTGSAASPNVPPAAPDAVASTRCRNCELDRGDDGSVRNATLSAASS